MHASLLYLGLLGAVIGGYFLILNRHRMGQVAQQAAILGADFVFGVVAIAGMWSDISDDLMPRQNYVGEGRIEVPRGFDGHYHLTLGINGVDVPFVVDTGATDIVLTRQDAARAGIDPDALAYLGRARTANGEVRLARVSLDEVRLGDMADREVTASVNAGEMAGSLLVLS